MSTCFLEEHGSGWVGGEGGPLNNRLPVHMRACSCVFALEQFKPNEILNAPLPE